MREEKGRREGGEKRGKGRGGEKERELEGEEKIEEKTYGEGTVIVVEEEEGEE